jgi:hypothetical protein
MSALQGRVKALMRVLGGFGGGGKRPSCALCCGIRLDEGDDDDSQAGVWLERDSRWLCRRCGWPPGLTIVLRDEDGVPFRNPV